MAFLQSHSLKHQTNQKKASKLTKDSTSPGEDNTNSELYKYVPEEFKLRLLKFLNNIYTKN